MTGPEPQGRLVGRDPSDAAAAKRAAARAAVGLVEDAMTLGLGSGSTASLFVSLLGERVEREGLRLQAVCTSQATEALARTCSIPVVSLDRRGVDLDIDGADEVDPKGRLLKGRGGAHVRERIVAAAARRVAIIVDASKLVRDLKGPVALELVSFGLDATLASLSSQFGPVVLRESKDGTPARSDGGNLLADLQPTGSLALVELAPALDAVPGLIGHGIFSGLCDLLVVGEADGAVREVSFERS